MFGIVFVSVGATLLATGLGLTFAAALRENAANKKNSQRIVEALQSLKENGYDTDSIERLSIRVNINAKRLTVSGPRNSRWFDIDETDDAVLWKVFVYDLDGSRRVMPPETFRGYCHEIEAISPKMREDAGFSQQAVTA